MLDRLPAEVRQRILFLAANPFAVLVSKQWRDDSVRCRCRCLILSDDVTKEEFGSLYRVLSAWAKAAGRPTPALLLKQSLPENNVWLTKPRDGEPPSPLRRGLFGVQPARAAETLAAESPEAVAEHLADWEPEPGPGSSRMMSRGCPLHGESARNPERVLELLWAAAERAPSRRLGIETACSFAAEGLTRGLLWIYEREPSLGEGLNLRLQLFAALAHMQGETTSMMLARLGTLRRPIWTRIDVARLLKLYSGNVFAMVNSQSWIELVNRAGVPPWDMETLFE